MLHMCQPIEMLSQIMKQLSFTAADANSSLTYLTWEAIIVQSVMLHYKRTEICRYQP